MRVNYRTGEREKRGHATEDSFAWGGSLFSKKFYLTQRKKKKPRHHHHPAMSAFLTDRDFFSFLVFIFFQGCPPSVRSLREATRPVV
jgi:hypothetical protein